MERCMREIVAIESRSSRAIPIYRDCASLYRIGQQNSESCRTRHDSMKILERIEYLEDELLPPPPGDTLRLHINGVDEEGKVVSTTVFEVPLPAPSNRRGRSYRGPVARRDW